MKNQCSSHTGSLQPCVGVSSKFVVGVKHEGMKKTSTLVIWKRNKFLYIFSISYDKSWSYHRPIAQRQIMQILCIFLSDDR